MKFADPKNDVAFKKIFGDENKKGILISFLNNILDFAGTTKEITDIMIANPYQVPKLEGLKYSLLDIKALDKRGIHYIIEMQVIHTEALEKRVLYYTSKAYVQQHNKADEYPKLNQVIFLGFLDFIFFKNNPDYATRHLILDKKTNEHLFTDFELNFVELPKFKKDLDHLDNVKEKWIYFVKNAGDMKIIPEQMKSPKEIYEAFEVANEHTWSQEELDAYDAEGIFIADQRQGHIYAQKQGLAEGLAEGRADGLEKGKKNKALEIAKKLKEKGMDPDFICETTGLTKDEISQVIGE
ncbi:MAG TPA: Rpn family recombination-promoting nuclease/putative transposase [Candidatus Kapabacteria bacterium]|nr:Rpn family recombination-promoting nuclease/putative transposase [Candidatus Kapabacteria bacterium]